MALNGRNPRPFATALAGLWTAILVVTSVGCATTREAEFDVAAPTAETPADVPALAEGDALWAERLDVTKLQQALAKWEEAASQSPQAETYVKLSRGHYFLADAFYAVEDNETARDAGYERGLKFAEKAIGLLAPNYVAAMKGGAKHDKAIQEAPVEAVPAMYWWATNLGKWAASKGFATRLKYKDDIKATMLRVQALDESYFYAAPARYFGAFEAATAGIAGGDLEKSAANFKKSIELAPNYLGTKVLYAEYYGEKKQDRALFQSMLEQVLAADPAVDPAIEPENRREQVKAKKLLDAINDKF